jgi:hypothetical protein
MLIFWVVTPCGLEGRYQRLGGTYCLHLQDCLNMEAVFYSETLIITHMTTLPHNPEDHNPQINLSSPVKIHVCLCCYDL